MPIALSPRRSVYDASRECNARRQAPIPKHYVAVRRQRNAPIHIVKAGTFGEVARGIIRDTALTECGMVLGERWELIGREGQTVECNHCRFKMSTHAP